MKIKEWLDKIFFENIGKLIEDIRRDIDRDNFMIVLEVKEYGLIDYIMNRNE